MRTAAIISVTSNIIRAWLVAALAATLLAGCAGPAGPTTTASASPTPSVTSATPSAEPTEAVGVYYLIDNGTDLRLAREFRRVAGDPLVGAVETMIAGPLDPDYATTWNPATRVLSITQSDEGFTVDLSADARTANVGSPGAALMIQQLVHTVTAAAGENLPVLLLIEGEPAGELWGAVSWDEPVSRAPALEVRLLVQLNSPGEGDRVSSPVVVTGEAAVFEATLPWKVLDTAGLVVKEGTAMTEEGMTFSPFRFEVALDPGSYVVQITEDDPSDGEGGPLDTDSRSIVVG